MRWLSAVYGHVLFYLVLCAVDSTVLVCMDTRSIAYLVKCKVFFSAATSRRRRKYKPQIVRMRGHLRQKLMCTVTRLR
jgi:hypothetical protein